MYEPQHLTLSDTVARTVSRRPLDTCRIDRYTTQTRYAGDKLTTRVKSQHSDYLFYNAAEAWNNAIYLVDTVQKFQVYARQYTHHKSS